MRQLGRQAERPDEVLLAHLEADRAPEVDELLLAEERVQPLPERVVGLVRVPGDRVRPVERRALAPLVAGGLDLAGEEAEAELLELLVDGPSRRTLSRMNA